MNKALPLFLAIIIATLLVFTACKNDDPTSPNDNDPIVTDPNPPDYPSFIRAHFQVDLMVTKQYDSHSTEEYMIFSPMFNMAGSFSNEVFYAESTWASFDGEQTEQLTITMDTLTGVLRNLYFHQVFNGPVSNYEMSVTLSDINRTEQDFSTLVFADSGMAVCSHINSVDYDYENTTATYNNFVITGHECFSESYLRVGMSNF